MESFAKLYIGMSKTMQKKITIDDTALNFGSGKIEDLFATPRLVAFMVEVCAQLIDPIMPEGFVTVGNQISVNHDKPSLIGATVTISVRIVGFDSGHFLFEMEAYDEFGKIGSGSHARSIVNYQSLMNKANERAYSINQAG